MIRISSYFPSLTCKNYRYYFLGQLISIIGSWVQSTSQQWYVTELFSEASFYLGLLTSIQFLPMMFLSVFVGVFIERLNKKQALLFTQISLMIIALIQGIFIITGIMNYSILLFFSFILGIINSIDLPLRQVMLSEIVDEEYISNAVALNSALFNGARVIGPSISGVLISYVGTGICFIINGITFIPVIFGVYKMDIIPKNFSQKLRGIREVIEEIKEGFKYIFKNKHLASILISVGFFGVFTFNYSVLLPILSREVFNLDSSKYGFLLSALGLGSFLSAVFIAMFTKKINRDKIFLISAYVVGVLLVLIGFSKNVIVVAIILFFIGIFNILFSTSANSTIQLTTDHKYLGRVMSIYSLLFTGLTPIGSLYSGTLSNKIGPGFSFLSNGIIFLIVMGVLTIFIGRSFFVRK